MGDYSKSLVYAKGDGGKPVTQYVFQKEGGAALNEAGAGTVLFYMRNLETGTNTIDGVAGATVTTSPLVLRYTWAAGDKDTAGRYQAWFTYVAATITYTVSSFEIIIKEPWEIT